MRKTLLFLFLTTFSIVQAQLKVDKLTCEYLANPRVIDQKQPRLAWINASKNKVRGQKQTAYQIRVASSQNGLSSPDLWDSQKVNSEINNRIVYQGKVLKSRQECWWQVRTWDKDGVAGEWSEPAFWRMGLLEKSDWQAKWIGAPWQGEAAIPKPGGGPQKKTEILPPPAPLLRKSFDIKKEVAKAVVFTTGLGYFELYANGKKVGNDVLVPNQTNYGKRPALNNAYIAVPDEFAAYKVMYLTYDITSSLKQGKNAIGGILGNGFYNAPRFWTASYGSPRFLAQLHVTYTDGTEEVIVTDETWKAAKSPILVDLVYDGEVYDARKEISDWSNAGFNDEAWQHAILRDAPYGDLVAHTAETDKVTKQYTPTNIQKLGKGHYKVDFPEEISGWLKLVNVKGPAGQKVHITFNGNLYSGENTYIFKGEGLEQYAPRFNWFVFSGVEITNWPGELKAENLLAEAVNTDLQEKATFETSNDLFNQIHKIWKRSQLDNTHGGIASDCPHRERSGYTGDAQVTCNTVMHNYDAQAFYQKWVTDMRDAQIPETGYVPNGAPWQPGCGGGVAWGAAINIIPWEFYKQYGAKDMLVDNYEAMKGYVRYMNTWQTPEGTMFSQREGHDGKPLKWWNLGEWAGVCNDCLPPDELVHTFYMWLCNDITAKTADVLGQSKEAALYRKQAEEVKTAFQEKFYNTETKSFGKYGANIFALKMNLPANIKAAVLTSLKNDIEENDGHFDTGIFGTRYFFEVLSENGLSEMAYDALNKTTEPSFGRWVELGSTTSREHWSEKGSHNHPMFGGGLAWFYTNLAGMQTDENEPGYKHIIFKPEIDNDLQFANYATQTPYGEAAIRWEKISDDILSVFIEVPVGSQATLYAPYSEITKVLEGGKSYKKSKGVKKSRGKKNVSFRLKSGTYSFDFSRN